MQMDKTVAALIYHAFPGNDEANVRKNARKSLAAFVRNVLLMRKFFDRWRFYQISENRVLIQQTPQDPKVVTRTWNARHVGDKK
jgi:hypothetical protein